jgi:hypothetical protein
VVGKPFGKDQEPFYYVYEPGKSSPTKMPCAAGTVWDSTTGVCNFPKMIPTSKPVTAAAVPQIPADTSVISTLDLNLLLLGGGQWNVKDVDMKKSILDTFQGEKVVKAVYDKDSGTTADPGVGGFIFTAYPDNLNSQEISFAWDVYYPSGFQFALGGKYGGVGIGHGAASGFQHSTTGSSNRVMWQVDGGIIGYIYPPEGVPQKIPGLEPVGHGFGCFNTNFAKALKYDAWNTIEIGTKMNTFKNGIPQLDGETYVIVNGTKAILPGINWSSSPSLVIDQFGWNTFFGGPDASPVDQYCYFKNFQMKEYAS